MPTYATPGVYIEELTGPGVIGGVGTSTAAFIGPAHGGPFVPKTITSFDDFKRYYGRASDGWPYLVRDGRRFYLAHAVQGFFENGGTVAVIVRVGSAEFARFRVQNAGGAEVFELEALAEGSAPNGYTLTISPSGLTGNAALSLVPATPVAGSRSGANQVTLTGAGGPKFLVGDSVQLLKTTNAGPQVLGRSVVTAVSAGSSVLTLEDDPNAATNAVRIAFIKSDQRRFRLNGPVAGVQAGTIVRLTGSGASFAGGKVYYSIVERVDSDSFVYLRRPFEQADGSAPGAAIDITSGAALETLDFALKVSGQGGAVLDEQPGLSLDPFHSGYIFQRVFKSIRVLRPETAPTTTVVSQLLVSSNPTQTQQGIPDNPSGVALSDYQEALRLLQDVDDVNLVCAPDAAIDSSGLVQRAVRDHCAAMHDRLAVLDVPPNLPPADSPSALQHLGLVLSSGGYAALYYPWLTVPEPFEPGAVRPLQPQSVPVPPSGHIAGVMARTDQERGVHYAPANTEVRGVMGLERVLSDREQGLINVKGVNALRIFPGEGRVMVWGARTTAPESETDWTYVNVRRLMLYIEESIEKGLRWAVFQPNDRPLWQSLKRTIGEFLDRVWKDGGLAGKTREQAYQVRIDEGLNPPDQIALGRLFIEIRVAPVRPAEFIVVRIGLWDGGAQVVEG